MLLKTNLRLILIVGAVFLSVCGVNARTVEKPAQSLSVTKQESKSPFEGLLADQIRVNKEKMRLDSIATLSAKDGEVEDGDLFDVDGLYDGDFSSNLVHPYKDGHLSVPDSLLINCMDWYMPHMGHVTSNYGSRGRRFHYGVDLKVQIGDPIHTVFAGRVRAVGAHKGGYGKYIVVRHHNGLETVYAHLSEHTSTQGQVVKAGDVIGLGGNTGRSTGSHLHFEVRLLGIAINPTEIFDFYNKVAHRDNYMFYAEKKQKGHNQVVRAHAESSPSFKYHKVRSGDTLYLIARKYQLSIKDIYQINKLNAKSKVKVGQVIRLS